MSALPNSAGDRETVQAINALKRGSYLLKYGQWGKPKLCPFHLSNDEKSLIWYAGKDQKQLRLSQISRIVPGQRTALFQRYPQPEKEYQSLSLIYGRISLDVDHMQMVFMCCELKINGLEDDLVDLRQGSPLENRMESTN